MTIDYAERARALVGTRFRFQGRDELGLDCVGVLIKSYGIDPHCVRRDYALRRERRRELEEELGVHFRKVPAARMAAGDAILMCLGGEQLHLAVRTAHGFVHAHCGIRRVVETPGAPAWPILGVYRRRVRARRV